MLKPNSDRLDYGKLLTPPEGFTMESAVGTSYSLDLDALVGVCMAMGLSTDPDSATLNNPIYLLEMLRRTGDRVTLFCQSGQIKVPSNRTSLYILLEKMVYQIQPQRSKTMGNMPSFHPKFWLVKYANKDGEKRYRLLVLSRNLTFDRSWDVSVCLDGKLVENVVEKSLPIADFVNYLRNSIRGDGANGNGIQRRKMLLELISELHKVEFSTESKQFHDFEFIPVGVPKENGTLYSMSETPLFASTFRELLIMSPFLSSNVINEFNNRNKYMHDAEYLLLTRRESLAKLQIEQCDKFKIYTMKDLVVDGEAAISETSDSGSEEEKNNCKQDIHAKLYFWNKDSMSELYLGSLNASHSALNGNIECVVRLMSQGRYLRLSNLMNDLFGGAPDNKDNPFELTPLTEDLEQVDDIQHKLEMKIKNLCQQSPRAFVEASDPNYSLRITFSGLKNVEGITIGPLLSYRDIEVVPEVIIDQLPLLQLSEFYRITAREGDQKVQRLVKIPTANIPSNREEAVVQEVIKDTQTFYQYIAFLLADDYLISALEHSDMQKSLFKKSSGMVMPALYERMLQTAATSPDKFREIQYIMKMVKKDGVIPDGFIELYDAFRKAVGIL